MNPDNWTELLRHWEESAKSDKDYTTDTERPFLEKISATSFELRRLGWESIIYCPKDGRPFLAIEAGYSRVFPCVYKGAWPTGGWWAMEAGDMWPVRPFLFKPMPDENTK